MPNHSQVRGMLLEEALLYLLRKSGYRTIEEVGSDDTLQRGSAGIEVKGRGGNHQIDAIAEYLITPPFSYPQRLLIEAKCYLQSHKKVEVEVIRNAVSVLKDVSEYWVSRGQGGPINKRYHYQYAIFSSTEYTQGAERFAFAHDVYLIPLAKTSHFAPINQAISRFQSNRQINNLASVRDVIRQTLREDTNLQEVIPEVTNENRQLLQNYITACRQVGYAILAVLAQRFPVFLVPHPDLRLNELPEFITVRIFRSGTGWTLRSATSNVTLFSFDLPNEMLNLYMEGDTLNPLRALDMKMDYLTQIQAITTADDHVRLITFQLDEGWINDLRRRIDERNEQR